MSKYLKRFKRKNLKKAGQLDETKGQTHVERQKNRNINRTGLPDSPTGSNHLEKFINRNRRDANLEQLKPGFKSQSKNKEE